MKMVLVFDTDDKDGMRTSMKMMQTILEEYSAQWSKKDPRFGKIEFIKMLKDFQAFSQQKVEWDHDADGNEYIPLKSYKEFADHVFREKNNSSYYKPTWTRGASWTKAR